jgi:replicative DNA helicase
VLGACLLEDEAEMELALSLLSYHDFSLDSHQHIWRRIHDLYESRQPVNIVTLVQELHRRSELEAVGGAAYVSDLTSGVPRRMGEQLRYYVERVKEYWRLRQLRCLGEILSLSATENNAVASDIVQDAVQHLEVISSDAVKEDASIASSIVTIMDRFTTERKLDKSPGLSFGIAALDAQTGGMMPGFQTAAGALSGVGKTTFMCQAILAALEENRPVDAFLLEPTKDQVTLRLLSLMTGVRYEAVVRPWISRRDEYDQIMQASARLAEMPLRLHDRATMTLDEVVGMARVGIKRYGTRLICLDYIQRLKIRPAERDEPLRLKVARASTALADLVKGTPCHSLLLSQITTGRKAGAAAVPTMFDFRESSQIENDAHTIVLLHRQYDDVQGHYTNDGAIFVPKQRFGSPCNIKVRFDPISASWTDDIFTYNHEEIGNADEVAQ